MKPFPSSLVPAPLPGECLYSVASHLGERWSRGAPQAARAFLGSSRAARDYIGKLDAVARTVFPETHITGRLLALKHTALPLQLPFFPADAREPLIAAALNGARLQLLLGTAASQLTAPRALRFCKACVESDRAEFGRAYWHTSHQVPGVYTCCLHSSPLWESTIRPDRKSARGRFVSAETAARAESTTIVDSVPTAVAGVAHDVGWLLTHEDCPAPGPDRLHALYRQLALSKGYSMKNGSVALDPLRRDLHAYYGDFYLKPFLGRNGRSDWVAAMIRPPRAHQQPLRHLMLSRFFGLTVQELVARATETATIDGAGLPHKFRIRNDARLRRLRPTKRAEWITAIKQSEGSTRERHEALYAWLWRNDRKWLGKHRKRTTARQPNLERWAEQDSQLAIQVTAIADVIRQENGRRVTRAAIAAGSRHSAWLIQDHPHLPQTNAAIAASRETAVEHALRRIARYRVLYGPALAVWRVREACGISVTLSKEPQVADALTNAVIRKSA